MRLFESTLRCWGLSTQHKTYQIRKKRWKRCYPLILHYFVFLDRELERMAEQELLGGSK
jgi:hypothetical protein